VTSETQHAMRLVSLSPLPPWALVALGLLLVAAVILATLGLRKEPVPWRRWALSGLRVLSGLSLLGFLLEPGIRDLQVAQIKNRLAILVDRSASMSFPVDEAGQTRAAEAAAYLQQVWPELARLEERYNLELYGFDPELGPTTLEALAQQPPRAGRTDLLSALRSLKAGEQGGGSRKLAGALLLSDGADNAELFGGLRGAAKAAVAELNFPVSTFLVGKEGLRDLSVERVRVDDFAFVRNAITVDVEVRGRGFVGEEIPVVLLRENQVIATKAVTLRSADDVQGVSFTFTPDQTGRFVFTAQVPVFPGEVVKENNSRSFVLKVIRDRVRVLMVVGRPSWDERFLRGLLRQDPNVDLVSFYILRTHSDEANVLNQDRELSLIPFPTDEIFDTKLHTFDVVVFQNFGYTEPSLSISMYEANLERYIHGGGAFVMLGGDRSFGEGRATLATLMTAMPVEPSGQPASEEPFQARLTAEGQRHPVAAIASGGVGTEAAWRQLPAIPGANLTRAKPGATVLLEHPFQTVDGKNAPVVALWEYGRGRAMAIPTDGTWFWAFPAHADGRPQRHYDRFWGNALRWLVRDPDLTTLRVVADPPMVEPGKPVAALVTARLADYQPAAEAQVKVELQSVEERRTVEVRQGTTGPDGVVRLEFSPPAPGAYKLVGTAHKGEQSLGAGEDSVAVRAVGPELSDASVRPDLLAAISAATSGKAYRLPLSRLPEVPLLEPPLVEVGRSKDRPLWDRWYFLLALVALLGTEWFLRRRFGYV
jgi:uncharacterized membrane protein